MKTLFLDILSQLYNERSKYVREGAKRSISDRIHQIFLSDDKSIVNGICQLTLLWGKQLLSDLCRILNGRCINDPKSGFGGNTLIEGIEQDPLQLIISLIWTNTVIKLSISLLSKNKSSP